MFFFNLSIDLHHLAARRTLHPPLAQLTHIALVHYRRKLQQHLAVGTPQHHDALGAALRRGGFSRAFSTQVRGVNVEELSARVRALGEKGWHNRMGLANRSGALAIGQASAREALRDGRVALVVLAEDAGEAAKQKFSRDAERKQLPTVWVREGAALGAALGREFVSVVTVASSPFADDLLRWATWLSSFGAESIVNVWTGASDAAPDSPASPCGAFESPHS